MLDLSQLTGLTVVFVTTLLVTLVATPLVARKMRAHKIVGRDVHKVSKPEIPEMCGLAVLLGLTIGALSYVVLFPGAARVTAAFIGTVLIAGFIGFVDDLRPLSARLKPLLTALACLPILLLGTYTPFPVIPLFGPATLTIVYVILIPIAIAVTSNAVNMMDVMNGAMAGTVSIISLAVTAILFISGATTPAVLSAGLLAAMLAFYYFNRYPAKVFGGDTGSLSVGAALGALSILGRIEAVMLVALIPHIMNAFYGLASVRGLRERREIRQRPTVLLDDGKLEASAERGAPITLTRLILAKGPQGEREIVRGMMFLTAVSSILACLTYWIMVLGKT
jgi:UDP-N-acetylglucosamine--dolichyl-phosphate N-acetylglucosaminephosphotransferase